LEHVSADGSIILKKILIKLNGDMHWFVWPRKRTGGDKLLGSIKRWKIFEYLRALWLLKKEFIYLI
jgi:hypothetical protein